MVKTRRDRQKKRVERAILVLSQAEAEDRNDDWVSPLDAVAHAVGSLCQRWAILETAIRKLLLRTLRMPDDVGSDLMLRCFDFRDQLSAIKVGVALMMIPDMVIDEVVETVDYIDNTLRLRRNRLVHDQWSHEPGFHHANRSQTTPKVVRPQAKQRREVRIDVQAEEVMDLLDSSASIGAHARYVGRLATLLDAPTARNFRLLTAKRPLRPLFRLQPEMQRPAVKRVPKP